MEINQKTGHLKCCSTTPKRVPINTIHSKCAGVTQRGKTCNGKLCEMGCPYQGSDGESLGFCTTHWNEYCYSMGWYLNLSRCANMVCDQKGLTLEQRYEIYSKNICQILGFPQNNKHFSKKREKEIETMEKLVALGHGDLVAKYTREIQEMARSFSNLTGSMKRKGDPIDEHPAKRPRY